MSNVINALVRIFFLKGRLHGAQTVADFFIAAILSRVWEWSGSGTNTRLRTRLGCDMLCTSGFVDDVTFSCSVMDRMAMRGVGNHLE